MITQSREQFLVDRYQILSHESEFSNITFPIPFISLPSEDEYSIGQTDRYFCKKFGDGNGIITEIDVDNFDDINSHSIFIYSTVKIIWKISGPRNNVIKNNRVDVEGIEEYNKRQLITGDDIINGLLKKFENNLTQFWRGF